MKAHMQTRQHSLTKAVNGWRQHRSPALNNQSTARPRGLHKGSWTMQPEHKGSGMRERRRTSDSAAWHTVCRDCMDCAAERSGAAEVMLKAVASASLHSSVVGVRGMAACAPWQSGYVPNGGTHTSATTDIALHDIDMAPRRGQPHNSCNGSGQARALPGARVLCGNGRGRLST